MAELAREMILEDCIARLQAGETVTSCLARYGAQAAELAPLLTTATRLQGVGSRRLTNGQHLRTKVALREALAERRARAAGTSLGWRGWWGQARGLAVAGLLIFGIFVTAGITSVAASRPGDVAYPVRVTLERAPAWLQFSPAGRAAAELQVAERRLADVTGYLQATGQVAPAAVDALLAGDRAATANAAALPERERAAITRRVAAHAETLAALARTAGPGAAELVLDEAAVQAAALAERLSPDSNASPTPTPPAQPALPSLTDTPASGAPAADNTPPAATPQPERSDATPTPTGRTIAPGQRATVLAQTATVAVPTASPAPVVTPTIITETTTPPPTAGGPVNTPVPGRRATALAATATPQPPTATPSPEPPPTERPSGATGTPAPGRRATALAQTATAQAAPTTPTPGGQ